MRGGQSAAVLTFRSIRQYLALGGRRRADFALCTLIHASESVRVATECHYVAFSSYFSGVSRIFAFVSASNAMPVAQYQGVDGNSLGNGYVYTEPVETRLCNGTAAVWPPTGYLNVTDTTIGAYALVPTSPWSRTRKYGSGCSASMASCATSRWQPNRVIQT